MMYYGSEFGLLYEHVWAWEELYFVFVTFCLELFNPFLQLCIFFDQVFNSLCQNKNLLCIVM